MVPCAGKFYGDADFLFQQVLAPALSAKTKLFVDHVWLIGWPTRLNWTPVRIYCMGYCEEEEETSTPDQTDELVRDRYF